MKRLQLDKRHRHHGFALVVTLLMTFLIVGLLMALLAVTTVENRVIRNQIKMSRARANAMQGVQVAMNRLHDLGGLDTRITATAGILGDDVANPWLTGIWKGKGMTSDERKKPIFWLTSGAEVDWKQLSSERQIPDTSNSGKADDKKKEPVTHNTKLDDPKPDNDTIWLLRKPVGEDPKLSVKARKVDLTRIQPFRSADPKKPYVIGHYAWWVADEGVKARVNLPLPEFNKDLPAPVDDAQTLAKWRLAAPQRAPWLMGGMESFAKDQVKLHKLLSFTQIPLMGSVSSLNTGLQQRWHDITADSLGLITNGREGGMKKDLSMFFEMDAQDREQYSPNLAGQLAPMLNFYSAYQRVQNAATSPVLEAQAFSREPADNSKSTLATAANNYLNNISGGYSETPRRTQFSPLVIRSSFAFSVQSQAASLLDAGGPTKKLVLVIDPIVTIWNPYNIALELDAYRIDSWMPTMHVVVEKRDPWKSERLYKQGDEVWHEGVLYSAQSASINKTPGNSDDPPVWTALTRQWSLATDVTLKDLMAHHGSTGRPRLLLLQQKTSHAARMHLKPGQVVTFSLNSNAVTAHDVGEMNLTLEPGWQETGGVSLDRLADLRQPLDAPDGRLRVHSESEVRITLEPARDAGYAGTDPFQLKQNYGEQGLLAEDDNIAATAWRESIGYQQGGGGGLADYQWAGTRTGRGPEFSHRMRSYAGKDEAGRPLPGASDVLKVGQDITDSAKRFLGVVEWRMKMGVAQESFSLPLERSFDPRGVIMRHPGRGYPATQPHWQIEAQKVSQMSQFRSPLPLDNNSSSQVVYEVPTAPLLSVGQLQHFPLQAFSRQPGMASGYGIGNSWRSPWVPATEDMVLQNNALMAEDLSYRWNQLLFDEYFFSSITPKPTEKTVNGRLANFLDTKLSKPLPNPRMKFYLDGGKSRAGLYSELTAPLDPETNKVPAFYRVAAGLMCEGAFNVHSTSVEAWKATLGSLSECDLAVCDPSSGEVSVQSASGTKFPRFSMSDSAKNDAVHGSRRLTEAQVTALAKEIVSEVKKRAPFTGLADFVNRRLADDVTNEVGTLQAAIDRTDINKDSANPQLTTQQLNDTKAMGNAEGMDWSFPYPSHVTGAVATAKPGSITQADILQALAPHLTTRSDTFKIRSYGDVISPISGKLEARAWVEVIVQRIPPYVNYPNRDKDGKVEEPVIMDPAWQSGALHNTSNTIYGRTWRIVRIRWLSPEEV